MINISEVPGDDEPHHETAHALGYIRPDGIWADPADTGDIHKPGRDWWIGTNRRHSQHHLPPDKVSGTVALWEIHR